MSGRIIHFFAGLLLLLVPIACDRNPRGSEGQDTARRYLPKPDSALHGSPQTPRGEYDPGGIAAERAAKDTAFRGTDSPIPETQRAGFSGLKYYPIDGAYAFRLTLEKFAEPDTVRLAATKGDIRTLVRFGRFQFTVGDTRCSLTAYMMPEHPGSLFIPFKDATNGSETYEVGRYIDLEMDSTGAPVQLDFNRAYNPYCAYNPEYTCPLVPDENILTVPVRAGERLPDLPGH